MRSTPLALALVPAALAQNLPNSGENGEMGGIFGMGFGTSIPPALSSFGSSLSSLFGSSSSASSSSAASSSAPKGGLSGLLSAMMENLDPNAISSIVPAGPEYPKGKMTLADYYNPGTGPYPAHFVTETTLKDHVIYAPKTAPPANVKMPVLIWGNGGCMSTGTPYGPFLTQVASYGYLAIANGPPGGAPPSLDYDRKKGAALPGPNGEVVYTKEAAMGGGVSKVKDMLDAIDWVVAGNAKKFGNIDTDTFITAGSSCGGLEAYSAAYHNPRVKLVGVYNSGILMPNKVPLLKELNATIVYVEGGPLDMGYLNSERDYDNLPAGLPAFKASLDSGHMGTFFTKLGGKYGTASVGLFEWLFRGDAKGKAMWTDPKSPGSLVSENWNVTYKNHNRYG